MALEYVQFNRLSDRRNSPIVHAVMSFLDWEVFGEPEPVYARKEPVPLLYGTLDNGELIAAASLVDPGEQAATLSLLGVRSDRRGSGLGSELLSRVEREAAQLGSLAMLVSPISFDEPSDPERVIRFYEHRGYIEHPDTVESGSYLLIKPLPESPGTPSSFTRKV